MMKKLYLLLLSLLMTFTLTGCNQQVEKASSKQSVTLSLEQTSSQDVDVYVDQDQIDTLKSQGAGTYELKLTKGNHELKVVQDGEETQKSFYVDSKETLHYQITNIENQLQIETDQVSFDENNVQDILSQIEEYSGQPYIEINNNTPTFKENEYTTKTYIQLNDLDEYGRTQKDQACLGPETLPTNKRESIGMVKPSGWKTQRYDDLISTKYLYNRCHQIGFALSGLNAEERNLMTGTRYFNVTGMLPFEEEVRDYIKNTNHHVLYEAIPVYKDDELVARGLIAQVTDEELIKDLINNGKATFYIGFDPTADSLHVGHFMALCLMKRLQMAGNKPIALVGGGTAMIGDPSGRQDMRKMMTEEQIQHNVECFKKQMSRFIDFSDGKAILANNADWLLNLNYVDFLREVGACFSVNNMLRAECYKQRMEKGLSFLEFNYMIMQSYDFLMLYKKYGCNLQFGGDDQWSNMLGGTELIRKKLGKDASAMTITLLLNSEGKKMGKTQSGAVWLDPDKTSPYDFYQYWRNVDDADVLKCIRMLTFIPLEEIEKMDSWEGAQLNKAKEILAYELTKLVHGEEEAKKAEETARSIFTGGDAQNMPSAVISKESFKWKYRYYFNCSSGRTCVFKIRSKKSC